MQQTIGCPELKSKSPRTSRFSISFNPKRLYSDFSDKVFLINVK
jgi:hypothetical protein